MAQQSRCDKPPGSHQNCQKAWLRNILLPIGDVCGFSGQRERVDKFDNPLSYIRGHRQRWPIAEPRQHSHRAVQLEVAS